MLQLPFVVGPLIFKHCGSFDFYFRSEAFRNYQTNVVHSHRYTHTSFENKIAEELKFYFAAIPPQRFCLTRLTFTLVLVRFVLAVDLSIAAKAQFDALPAIALEL